jgi:hypothetical protein
VSHTWVLLVRSTLADISLHDPFDDWYSRHHVPDSMRALNALSAHRMWSLSNPLVHYASYDFADEATIREAVASDAIRELISEYDRRWSPDMVTRTREMLHVVESMPEADVCRSASL